jgi:hypothetical protein
MKAPVQIIFLLHFIFASSFVNATEFQIRPNPNNETEKGWSIYYGEKSIANILSIGGPPSIIKEERIRGPKGEAFSSLRYHAGSAGTQTMTYMDRLLIIQRPKKASPRVLADLVLELVRETDGRRETMTRTISWSKNGSHLSVGQLDEETAGVFQWDGKNFNFKPNEPTEKGAE